MSVMHKTRAKRTIRGATSRNTVRGVSKEARLMKSGNGQYVGITKDILRQAGATPDMRYRIDVVGPREVLVHFIDKPEVARLTLDEVFSAAKRKKIAIRDIAAGDCAAGREVL